MTSKYRLIDAEANEMLRAKTLEIFKQMDIARSAGCRDRDGRPLLKPPALLAGMGSGVAAERWLEKWAEITMKHNRVCVRCREQDERERRQRGADAKADPEQAEGPSVGEG